MNFAKKGLSWLLALSLVVSLLAGVTIGAGAANDTDAAEDASAPAATMSLTGFSGSGTADDPYQITSEADLRALATQVNAGENCADQYFQLTADITVADNWTPIGSNSANFSGTFNGDGHTISLNVSYEYGTCKGLFGCISNATVKNLVVDGEMTVTQQSAAIVGTATNSTLENLGNKANITSITGKDVGGIAGKISNCTVQNCYNTGDINGGSIGSKSNGAAGIVGTIASGKAADNLVKNCYNTGAVTTAGTNDGTGGIVGSHGTSASVTIQNCYSIGKVTGQAYNTSAVGAIIGYNYNDTVENCYYLTGSAKCGASYKDLGTSAVKSEADMKAAAFVTTLGAAFLADNGNLNNGYPILSWQAPSCTHENTQLRNAKDATCTAEGYTGDTYCLDCNTVTAKGQVIAKLPHTKGELLQVTKEPTCTATGLANYTCSVCKQTFAGDVPAAGHKPDADGKCSVCGTVDDFLAFFKDVNAHATVVNDAATPWTVNEDKEVELTGTTASTITITAKEAGFLNLNGRANGGAHLWVQINNVTYYADYQATTFNLNLPVEAGDRVALHYFLTVSLDLGNYVQLTKASFTAECPHTAAAVAVTKQDATCLHDGYTQDCYICPGCGETFSDQYRDHPLPSARIPAKGHNYGVVDFTQGSIQVRTCLDCGLPSVTGNTAPTSPKHFVTFTGDNITVSAEGKGYTKGNVNKSAVRLSAVEDIRFPAADASDFYFLILPDTGYVVSKVTGAELVDASTGLYKASNVQDDLTIQVETTRPEYGYELRHNEKNERVAYINSYAGQGGEITLPETVTFGDKTFPVVGVAERAFSATDSLCHSDFSALAKITKITVPASVQTVEPLAFNYCGKTSGGEMISALREIVFQGENTVLGASSLSRNVSLSSITLPAKLQQLPSGLFSKDTALETITIPETVTQIGGSAFAECTKLNSVIFQSAAAPEMLAEGIASDKHYPFVGCTVTAIVPNAGTYQTAWKAMLDASEDVAGRVSLQQSGGDLYLTRFTEGGIDYRVVDQAKKLVEVEKVTFATNTEKTLTIPETVTSSGITFTVTGIGQYALGYDGVHTPQKYQFTKVSFPGSLTYIKDWGCAMLEQATEIDLSNTKVESIGNYAFNNCTAMETVKLPATLTTLGASKQELKHESSTPSTDGNLDLGSTGLQPGAETNKTPESSEEETAAIQMENVFRGCQNLKQFVVADGNNTYCAIGGVLFSKDKTKLIRYPVGRTDETYAIPEGTQVIEEGAFMQFATVAQTGTLQKVSFPKTLTEIKDGAFRQSSLTEVTLPANVKLGRYLFDCSKQLVNVTVENGVTAIPEDAFWGCKALEAIQLPTSVKTIGESAFEESGLKQIDLNRVESIGAFAFYYAGLTEVTVPASVKTIGDGAFMDCANLTKAVVEGSKLAPFMFWRCSKLTDLSMTKVTEIGDYALGYCSGLTALPLNGVTAIGDGAFRNCTKLTDVTLPESLQELGIYVFADCLNLKTLTFADDMKVTTVPEGTLYECLNFETLNLGNSISSTEGVAFYATGWNKNMTFTVNCDQPQEHFFRNEFDAYLINLGENQILNQDGQEIVYDWLGTRHNDNGYCTYIFRARASAGGCGGNCGGGDGVAEGELAEFTMSESSRPVFNYAVRDDNQSAASIKASNPTRFAMLQEKLPTVITVNAKTGSNSAEKTVASYTLSDLESLAKANKDTQGYQFVGMKGWAVMAATEYVTLEDLLGGESFGPGDKLVVTADDYTFPISYEDLQKANSFFPNAQSKNEKQNARNTDGAVEAKPVLALSWNTGVIESTDATDQKAVERVAETAYKSTNLRFACGLSAKDYDSMTDNCEDFDAEICSGYRLLQRVQSLTVVHAGSNSGGGSGGGTGGGGTVTPAPTPAPKGFTDVPENSYFADAVDWAVKQNITTGTSSTTFSPDENCTRAQVVTFLWRAAGSPESTANVAFTDVKADAYYAKAVAWAVENKITTGTTDTTFEPEAVCTRAQVATFLWRAAKSPAATAENPFADVKDDAYYAKAVAWAVEKKITSGTDANHFSPDENCTRAQIVTFLFRNANSK